MTPQQLSYEADHLVSRLSYEVRIAECGGDSLRAERLDWVLRIARLRSDRRRAAASQAGYKFKAPFIFLRDSPEALFADCLLCGSQLIFTHSASLSHLGTELLLHHLKCSAPAAAKGLLFACDDWQPRQESWERFYMRVIGACGEAIEISIEGAGNVN